VTNKPPVNPGSPAPPGPHEENRYLWDRSGPSDSATVRLEQSLAPLRHRGRAPVPYTSALLNFRLALAAAAALVLAAAGLWYILHPSPAPPAPVGPSWAIAVMAGAPRVDGAKGTPASLAVGRTLETDADARVRLDAGAAGQIWIEPGSRVRLVADQVGVPRLAIEHGTILANAATGPSGSNENSAAAALAFDTVAGIVTLAPGTAGRLAIDDRGRGTIELKTGLVTVRAKDRETRIPSGATVRLLGDRGPGIPVFNDAPIVFLTALTRLDDTEGIPQKSKFRANMVQEALAAAGPHEAVSLWNLIPRLDPADRLAAAERLAALVRVDTKVSPEGLARMDAPAIEAYWRAAIKAREGGG
jgi:hypothetical protein